MELKNEWKLGMSNKSIRFISPILGLNKEGNRIPGITYLNFFQNPSRPELKNFVNVFIGDDVVNIEDKVLLLYKFSGTKPFLDFEEWVKLHPLYEGTYDPDRSHVMFVFGIPDKVKEDYNFIKEGKYSKISKFYLDAAIDFLDHHYAVKEGKSPVYNIVTKAESAYIELEKNTGIKIPRDMEACSLMYRKEEYYQPEYVVRSILKGGNNEF